MKEKFFLALATALIRCDETNPGVLRAVAKAMCEQAEASIHSEDLDTIQRRRINEMESEARLLEAKAQLKSLEN